MSAAGPNAMATSGGVANGVYGQGGSAAAATAPGIAAPQQNLNQIVTDYLLKRGFTRTEEAFRVEASRLNRDGRPIHLRMEEMGPERYAMGFKLLQDYVEGSLDIYKSDLRRLLWPVFVYCYLGLVDIPAADLAQSFLTQNRAQFEEDHGDELRALSLVTLPSQIRENSMTMLYTSHKYKIPLAQQVFALLFAYLTREEAKGGLVIIQILTNNCETITVDQTNIDPYSFDSILRKIQNTDVDDSDMQEGIMGGFTGAKKGAATEARLHLGPLPMEPDLRADVQAEIEDEESRNPPLDGRPGLVDEFDRKIKREESADGPSRSDIPLPPSRARDIMFEIQKMREDRERFRISGRTGGVGVPVSCCMFTFHNTLGSVSCMDFSNDNRLVACGTMDSYIRVWTMDGKALPSRLEQDVKTNNRKLIGHSGPVYGVSFSDAISPPSTDESADMSSKLLLSCSADGQVRLWSLDVWSCLCIYKAHDGPVLRVSWSPNGHYFATGGWDKTVRIFMQDHASAQRICVGHDTSVSAITWHPNGSYVFSASDDIDKTIRMWSVITGECVRVFAGHTDYITALECASNGKLMASADTGGNIFFWDLETGDRIKKCRGHGKGGIPSLSFSVESNVLASAGLDGTVRVWDVELPASLPGNSMTGAGGAADGSLTNGVDSGDRGAMSHARQAGQAAVAQASVNGASGVAGVGSSKKKGREVMITPDQISAFPTKKTPVLKVQFTRMNLCVAGGCYNPEK